jgi:hypothetical protein
MVCNVKLTFFHDSNQKSPFVEPFVNQSGQEWTRVDFCGCKPDAIWLLSLGYLAGSPVAPQTAFSLLLLIFHNYLWNHCHIGALPFTTALTQFLEPRSQRLNVRGKKHVRSNPDIIPLFNWQFYDDFLLLLQARNMRKPFTAAVDLYCRLEEESNAVVFQILKLSKQQVLASTTCPACFGPQLLDTSVYPTTTRNCLVVCLDGNFQHRHHTKASRNHQALWTPAIFLKQSEVDHAVHLIWEREEANTPPDQVFYRLKNSCIWFDCWFFFIMVF